MFAHHGDELRSIAIQLRPPDPRQHRELFEFDGLLFGHLAQRGIMKDHVRRQSALIRQAFAQCAQSLEEFYRRWRRWGVVARPS